MSAPGGEQQISPELQNFIQRESQVAQIQGMIASLTDVCWDKCVTAPGSYLSSKEESCLQNCAGRFIDCTQFILQRAQHKAEGSSGM
jgi:import inner membrane translocase subunit TIM8